MDWNVEGVHDSRGDVSEKRGGRGGGGKEKEREDQDSLQELPLVQLPATPLAGGQVPPFVMVAQQFPAWYLY